MLRELERLLHEQTGPLNLPEMAEKLDTHPSVVAGMLETLTRMGRLTAVSPECAACDTCPAHNACQIPLRRGNTFRRNYGSVR